jgi:hypothetical protein
MYFPLMEGVGLPLIQRLDLFFNLLGIMTAACVLLGGLISAVARRRHSR